MNRRSFVLGCCACTLGGSRGLKAQQALNLEGTFCSFNPSDSVDEQLYTFASSKDARKIVEDIMSTIGLVPRFEVFAANVPNAAAVIHENQRLIVYSESWIANTIEGNRWAAIALMAHEIAHHLNGHTLERGGSRPPTELEADSFAGYAVQKLGGSLRDAQSLFMMLPESGSDTHPGRNARLEAVAVGFREAQGSLGAVRPRERTTDRNEPECFVFDGEKVCD